MTDMRSSTHCAAETWDCHKPCIRREVAVWYFPVGHTRWMFREMRQCTSRREGAAHGRLREQSYAHVMKSIDNYATCVYTFANRPTTLLRINFSGTAPAASWHLRVFLLRDINAKFTIIMFANQIISLAYIQNGC